MHLSNLISVTKSIVPYPKILLCLILECIIECSLVKPQILNSLLYCFNAYIIILFLIFFSRYLEKCHYDLKETLTLFIEHYKQDKISESGFIAQASSSSIKDRSIY